MALDPNKIKCIQNALLAMCYNPGKPDGKWGSGTRGAVERFQSYYGLNVDGKVGTKTWNKLVALIKPIQCAFNKHGFNLRTDGIADNDTYNAIIRFQTHHHIKADGMVGPATWKLLNTLPSRPSNRTLIELAKMQGLFKYLTVATIGVNDFNQEFGIPTDDRRIEMKGEFLLHGTYGNNSISVDLSNRKFSGASLYSGQASGDFNINKLKNHRNIVRALDNVGIKIGELNNAALRVKLATFSTPTNFEIIIEYSYSINGVIIYEILKIHYKDFKQEPSRERASVFNKKSCIAAVCLLGVLVACCAAPQVGMVVFPIAEQCAAKLA